MKDLVSYNWKNRTKEARLILQSGIYISYNIVCTTLKKEGRAF